MYVLTEIDLFLVAAWKSRGSVIVLHVLFQLDPCSIPVKPDSWSTSTE